MDLTIKIEFGNDAMQTLAQAKAAILRAFDRIDGTGDSVKIRDINGNTVGTLTVTDEQEG